MSSEPTAAGLGTRRAPGSGRAAAPRGDFTGVRVLIEADRSRARSGSRLVVLAGSGPVRVLDLCELDGRLALAR
jgi:hypothetical protein